MGILEDKFSKISGGRILDVGTGGGSFIPMFTDLFKEYTEIIGIDSNEKAIKMAQESFRQENIRFICMDAAKMSFEDGSMDTVCISNTLHHLPNYEEVLKEMYRVLKPGGLFIINEMFCDNQTKKQLSHVYIHHLCAEIDTIVGNYHGSTFKKQEIIYIAKQVGINVEDIFEYSTAEEQQAELNADEEREILDSCFDAMDKSLERIKGTKQYTSIKNRVNSLRQRLYEVGFMSATELVILGRK